MGRGVQTRKSTLTVSERPQSIDEITPGAVREEPSESASSQGHYSLFGANIHFRTKDIHTLLYIYLFRVAYSSRPF